MGPPPPQAVSSPLPVWAAGGISSASPSMAPSSSPRASPLGTSPRRTMALRTSCEGTPRGGWGGDTLGTPGRGHTRCGGGVEWGHRGRTELHIAVFSLVSGHPLPRLCPLPPPQRAPALLSPENAPKFLPPTSPAPPLAPVPDGRSPSGGGGAPRVGHAPSVPEGAWRVPCSQWPGPLTSATPPLLGGRGVGCSNGRGSSRRRRPFSAGGGVACSVLQPMGGRAEEEEAWPEAAAGRVSGAGATRQ